MARRTAAEMAEYHKQQAKKYEEQAKASKSPKLTKDSEGIANAIAAIDNASKLNGVTLGDVVIAVAKMKKMGLDIKKKPRASKKP